MENETEVLFFLNEDVNLYKGTLHIRMKACDRNPA